MKNKPGKPKNKDKTFRNRLLAVIIISLFLVLVMGFILMGSMRYRILRVRGHSQFDRDSDYILKEVIIATEVEDPGDEDETWYYKSIGGAYNYLDFELENITEDAKEEFILDLSLRLLIENEIDSIFIIFIVVEVNATDVEKVLVSEEIDLYKSTDIQLNGYDYSKEEVETEITDLSANFLLEAILNIV